MRAIKRARNYTKVRVTRDNSSKASPWRVVYSKDGKTTKLGRFRTKEVAEGVARTHEHQINKLDVLPESSLSPLEIARLVEVKQQLEAVGLDVYSGVQKLAKISAKYEKKPLSVAIKDFLDDRQHSTKFETWSHYDSRLGKFLKAVGNKPIRDFSDEDSIPKIRQFLIASSTNDNGRHKYWGTLYSFFNYAVTQGWIDKNPMDRQPRFKVKFSTPKAYTPKEIETIFRKFEAVAPEFIPFLALQAFGGLRPTEATNQPRNKVNFDAQIIQVQVGKKTAGNATTRLLENLSPCLWAWLNVYWRDDQAVALDMRMDTICKKKAQIIKETGVELIYDGLRHSALTHYLPLIGYDRTAQIAGHSGGSIMLRRHYTAPTGSAEANAYFNVYPKNMYPESNDNIIAFPVNERKTTNPRIK